MEPTSAAGASTLSTGASSAAVGGLLGFLNYNTAKRMADFNYNQQMRYLLEAPTKQVEGYRAAGINPMLAYMKGNPNIGSAPQAQPSNIWGSGLRDASDWQTSARSADRIEQETKTESYRTVVQHNEAIKGNYELLRLAAEIDAAMLETKAANSTEALTMLAQPRIRAGLQELRAAFASAKNDAEVYEALNSKAVNMALDVLGKITGSGSAIAGAVDRYRARSQRGDIINLNKD